MGKESCTNTSVAGAKRKKSRRYDPRDDQGLDHMSVYRLLHGIYSSKIGSHGNACKVISAMNGAFSDIVLFIETV